VRYNEAESLSAWMKRGGCMFSRLTTARLCRVLVRREGDLHAMALGTLFQVPGVGKIARREIERFCASGTD
jgi:hypothetical protein